MFTALFPPSDGYSKEIPESVFEIYVWLIIAYLQVIASLAVKTNHASLAYLTRRV